MVKHSKPPARQRYETTHPTLTVRIPADVRTAIAQAAQAEGLSIGEWLQAQVAGHVTDVAAAYQRGYTLGSRGGWMAGILNAEWVHSMRRSYNQDAIRKTLDADSALAHVVGEICTVHGHQAAWDNFCSRR